MNEQQFINPGNPETQIQKPENRLRKYENKIRDFLKSKNLSSDDIDKVIEYKNLDTIEMSENILNPNLLFSDIAKNADTEWREITELARVPQTGRSIFDWVPKINEMCPDLEVKVEINDCVHHPVKVRKIRK